MKRFSPDHVPTPYCVPRASIVRPSPRLIATCAWPGRPPVSLGGLENEKSSAPRVRRASSTLIAEPSSRSARYCCHEPSGRSTPACAAAHCVSSEQSNVVGSGSADIASAPNR
ncbi:hypothetical protein BJF78_34735 [Pseudonocardia sp. CNS-139]|nr:hypothetical protein BJF78_34735 [Pseudonocardia sp. CNS-139]